MSKYHVFAIFVMFFMGCKSSDAPDVSHIKTDITWVRTEQDLQAIMSKEKLIELEKLHPSFYKIYLNQVLPIYQGNNRDSLSESFLTFTKDTIITNLLEKVSKEYNDIQELQDQSRQLYQYLQYYFPEKIRVPNLYTFVSDFRYQIFIFEDDDKKDGIAIGLDMFLNPTIDYKSLDPDNTNFSDYITRSWNKDHIIKKIADLHVADILGESPGHRMLDQMIHNGKTLYLLKKLLPSTSDTIIHEYSSKQLKWCQDNELQMWSFFLDNKLFYESNPSKIAKYIYPSPQSPDMPSEAPGRTGNYIGLQIVHAYMERYPKTTLQELIHLSDSQMILEKSKFKPQK